MTLNFRNARWSRTTAAFSSLASCLLLSAHASAEVTVAKGDTWEAYLAGRVGAFVSYNVGEGYPVPLKAGSMVQQGGGVDAAQKALDTEFPPDAMGNPDVTKQGKLSKMRVRSGYYPNIITLGVRKSFTDQLKMTAQLSIWGTVESSDRGPGKAEYQPANGIRDNGVNADFREGYMQLEGDRWGMVRAGRFMGLAGRGMTEIDALYGHGYGVGFPTVSRAFNLPNVGDLTYPGPTGGMAGFGLLSATYNGGLTYTTPNLAGLRATLGLFDGSTYVLASWGSNRTVRPELELAYDLKCDGMLLHLFGSGGIQKLHKGGSQFSETIWGTTFGGRFEIGPLRVGVGGFTGKGAGVNYAFDDNPAQASTVSLRTIRNDPTTGMPITEKSYEIRSTRGFVGMVQVVLGPVDIGGGAGQTQIGQVDADKTPENVALVSSLKSQTGITAAVVYHLNESLHFDVDFMNGAYEWTNGEHQKLNVVNAGVTLTF